MKDGSRSNRKRKQKNRIRTSLSVRRKKTHQAKIGEWRRAIKREKNGFQESAMVLKNAKEILST